MTEEEIQRQLEIVKAEIELEEKKEQEKITGQKKGSKNSWTAEDFERYGAILAEKQKAEATKAETSETEVYSFNFELLLSELLERKKQRIEKNGGRVRSQYGEQLTDDEVIKVLEVEEEMSWCKNCNGFYCRKIRNVNYYKTVTYDAKTGKLKINSSYCQRLTQSKYKLSKIPAAYIDKTFEDYQIDKDNESAVKMAKKLLERPDMGVYLFGDVGTGKTLLAAIMAQELIRRGREVIFATVPTVSARIRSTFNQKELRGEKKVSEEEIVEKLYTVPTLILDDIGMEKPTRFVCSTLCNIFNERYNARLQTIMTSNYSLEELENIFNNPIDSREKTFDGTRIYDRCKQMCIPIELKGKSRRG